MNSCASFVLVHTIPSSAGISGRQSPRAVSGPDLGCFLYKNLNASIPGIFRVLSVLRGRAGFPVKSRLLPPQSRHRAPLECFYDPLYGSFVGDQGAWSTAKKYFTAPPNGVAKLHFGAQPDGRNGGRLRPPDPGRNPGGRQHSGGGGHGGFEVPRRRGRRRHAGHPGRGACWNPRSPR